MKPDKRNDLLPRDAALARLLEEALESKRAGDARIPACPDAEILAAYAEHGLSEQEALRWEGHIADCGRCQEIIAGVVLSGENLEDAELDEKGIPAPASAIRKPAAQPGAREISRWLGFWRWWVPGFGLAAALALWFVLRPALSPRPVSAPAAANDGIFLGAARGNAAVPSGKAEETQMAQANLPPPPAPSAGVSGGAIRDSEQRQANSPIDALKKPAKRESLQSERQSETQALPALDADRAAGAAEAQASKDESQSGGAADQKKETVAVNGEMPAVATAAPAPAPQLAPRSAAQAASPAAAAPAPQQSIAPSARALATNRMQASAKAAGSPIEFASPDRSVLWRVGPGGLIESSSDQGQTWSPQASGVTADLLAGAAPKAKVAWVVGRGGIILRTEDGEHWQRVMPPALAPDVPTPDWIGIDASDELHASVTSRDLHRYATADGGRTWVQQP